MKSGKYLSLFVFIDAFGWEILKEHQNFLADLVPHRSCLKSVLGYSSTCDPTIITGLMPQDHGHFSFFYYNPKESPFALCRPLRFLPKSITSRGRVRRVMSRLIRRVYGYTGYFQIYNMPFDKLTLFDYSEKRDLYQPGGINSGSPTIFDHLREHKLPFHLSDWRASEEANLSSLEAAIGEGNIRFSYLYMAAMDAILHADGKSSKRASKKIEWYDSQIRKLIKAAEEHYDGVNLYLFSDHGMTDIHDLCDLIPRIDKLGLTFGEDYAAVYDSTMARFWFLKEGSKEKIVEALQKEERGRILFPEDLEKYQCRFPENKYGEIFFLLNPGVLLCPSFLGQKPMAGMHGYDPADKDTDAMFATNVSLPNPPKGLEDLYPLMKAEADAAIESLKN